MDPNQLAQLLLSDEEPSVQQGQAYARALGGQKQAGLLGLLTGDKVLSGVGDSLLQGAQQDEGYLAKLGEAKRSGSLRKSLALEQARREAAQQALARSQKLEDTSAQQTYQQERDVRQAASAMERAKVMAGRQDNAQQAAATEKVHERAEELRKELSGHPVTKAYQEVSSSFGKINRITGQPPSAAGDMGMVFSFMKMMDPGSSVREGEYANASNTTGIPGQLLNAYNKAKDGQLLSPGQRKDFLKQARGFYDTHAGQYSQLVKKYKTYAPRVGVDPEDVSFGLDVEPQMAQQAGGPAASTAEDAEAVEWAKANPNDPLAAEILRQNGAAQ